MKYKSIVFEKVGEYIFTLSIKERAKITAGMNRVASGDFKTVHIKQLRGDIKELKIKQHRIIFFIKHEYIYFIGAFLKKTSKTPKKEIELALKIYKEIP